MALDGPVAGGAFLLGRALFAAVLGFLALGNLLSLEETVAYAKSKGAPAPRLTVPVTSLALLAGAGSVLLGVFPLLGALDVLVFLVGVTPVMHDYWNQEGMDRQTEQVQFLKNVGLAGGAVVFAAISSTAWPYAVGLAVW